MTDNPLLVVDDLSVHFATEHGWTTVVDSVGFTVDRGETLGIVGESGSGKSVTSMAIMGLIDPPGGRVDATSVRLNDRELSTMSERQLEDVRGAEIGMVFQEPSTSLNPAFTVGDQVAEVARRHLGLNRKDAWQRAVETLGEVGIPNAARRAHAYPHEFSGGMRQRVMIASAVVCRPQLLIADEPTTALDVTIQAQVLALLHRLSEEMDMAMILITHDLGVVAEVCQRVIVMYAGQLVEEGDGSSFFARPRHPYTEGLLASMPRLATRSSEVLATIPGVAATPGNLPPGCRFHPRCEYAIDACTTGTVELRRSDERHAVRCLRSDELTLRGTR